SVAANGDVYYGREPLPGCGRDLQIVRRRPPGARRVVATVPAGYDLDFTFVAGKRVLFDRFHCPDGNLDVYDLRRPDCARRGTNERKAPLMPTRRHQRTPRQATKHQNAAMTSPEMTFSHRG